MISLIVNGFGPAKEAPLFEFDHETLSYQGEHGCSDLYEWSIDKQAWKSLTQIQEVTKPLRLEADENMLLTFIDHQGTYAHYEEEGVFLFLERDLQLRLNLVSKEGDRVLARMVNDTGEWEVSGQDGLCVPKIIIEPLSVSPRALGALRLEPSVRDRLSSLAERAIT